MVLRAEKLKVISCFKKTFLIVLSSLLLNQSSFVKACLESDDAYGDSLSSSTSFSDYDFLVNNFKNGMVVDSVKVCQNVISTNTYIVGIQLSLINYSTGERITGDLHGSDLHGFCETRSFSGTVISVRVGRASHYSEAGIYVINYLKMEDDFGTDVTFGQWILVNGGMKTYSFDVANGGFIGFFGTSTDMINQLGPYYDPGICTCE